MSAPKTQSAGSDFDIAMPGGHGAFECCDCLRMPLALLHGHNQHDYFEPKDRSSPVQELFVLALGLAQQTTCSGLSHSMH